MAIKQAKLILVIFLLAAISPLQAQEKTGHQTMASGPGVWRIELRNFKYVRMIKRADSDADDEIHSVKVILANEYAATGSSTTNGDKNSSFQYDAVQETAPNMTANSRAGNSAYVTVRSGRDIELSRKPNHTYDLWIHTKQFYQGEEPKPFVFFTVTVRVRELSCFRERVCNRGYTGELTYQFKVPVPEVLSTRCIPANTFDMTRLGSSVEIRRRPSRSLLESWEISEATARANPQMFLAVGEICIASTSK